MYIDSLTIAAIVVFIGAMGLFVKACVIDGCILSTDRKTEVPGEAHLGGGE